jgi:hypothetical protein
MLATAHSVVRRLSLESSMMSLAAISWILEGRTYQDDHIELLECVSIVDGSSEVG